MQLPAGSFELQAHESPLSGPSLCMAIPVAERRTIARLLEVAAWDRSHERTRIYVCGEEVPRDRWRWIRPRAGTRVVIVGCPAAPAAIGAVLSFFAKVASAVGSSIAGASAIGSASAGVAGALGAGGLGVTAAYIGGTILGGAAIVAGVSALGSSLIDAPSQDAGTAPGAASPTLQGSPNNAHPNEPFPYVFGDVRGLPPYGAFPSTSVRGTESDALYLFVLGPGPLAIDPDQIRIGEVPITSFADVEVAVREGRSTDGPLRLYSDSAFQQPLNNILNPLPPTDADGIGEWVQTPVPGTGHVRLGIDLNFTQGIGRISDSGRNHSYRFGLQIEYRVNGGSWITATTLQSFTKIGEAKPGSPTNIKVRGNTVQALEFRGFIKQPFQVGFAWDVDGTDGDIFDVRMRRVEVAPPAILGDGSAVIFGQVVWYAVKGFNLDAPPVVAEGIATVEIKVPVNEQFRGLAQNFSVRARREARIYNPSAPGGADADGWSLETFETRNPAAMIRDALQGPGNIRPEPDSRIDIDSLTDFYVWCRDFDDDGSGALCFDLFVDFSIPLEDLCRTIAAAGLGRFGRDTQGRWSVVFDGPKSSPVAMVNAATMRGLRMEILQPRETHGIRAQFTNRDTGFDPNSERIIYADGYSDLTADPGKLETIRFTGVTDPALIYVHARRRLAEQTLRRRRISFEQDMEHLAYSAGDLILLGHPGVLAGTNWGRVQATSPARYRDTFEASPAPYAPVIRSESGATLAIDSREVYATHGIGVARVESTGSGAATVAQPFEVSAPQDWSGLAVKVDARAVSSAALDSVDGLRIRLYGPTSNDWAEWQIGTSDGLAAGAWATAAVVLGTDSPTDAFGSFSAATVIRWELITNTIDAQAGRVWYFDNFRVEDPAGSISELVLDQDVDLAVALSPSIDHRRADPATPTLTISTLPLRGLADFGVGSDRTVPAVHLSAPITAGTGEPVAGDLVTLMTSLRVICQSKEPGPGLTAQVTVVDEAPGVQTASESIPAFDPGTAPPVPINILGPGRPTIVQVVADERALVESREGALRPSIRLYLSPSTSRARPPTDSWSVKYRRKGGSSFTSLPTSELSPFVVIDQVDELETYEIVVQAVGPHGRASEPVTTEVVVTGKTNLPPDVEEFRLEGVLLRWSLDDLPSDLAGFEIRRGGTNSTFETSRRIHGPALVAAPPFDLSEVDPGFARLHIKAVDLVGNQSANESTIDAFVGAIPEQNQVDLVNLRSAGFPLIDQVDRVLSGFEDNIHNDESPDADLDVVYDDEESPGPISHLTGLHSTVLEIDMDAPLSGLRSLRMTAY